MGGADLIHELGKLAAEIAGAIAVVGLLVVGQKRVGGHWLPWPSLAAIGLAGLLCVSLLLHARSTASTLNQARRHAVGPGAGLEHCSTEVPIGQRLVPERIRFLDWVKARLPARALYAVDPYSGPPDLWCVTVVLLPALPASGGDRAGWTIAAGVPPAAQASIDGQDPDAKVFAPGYVLARNPGR
jgi:Flp pilus assembly protein CpaB